MTFNALMVRQDEAGNINAKVESLELEDLPDEDVLIDVAFSTLNYKDGLCMTGGARLVRDYPHIPGVDFAGTVIESRDPRYKPGDEVLVSGWRVGEIYWGGYAQKARVRADFIVPLPKGLSLYQAMAIGTAGLTAMYGIMALEAHGLKEIDGSVLVTGAAGGVGSVAVALLKAAGYEVSAVSGRAEAEDYLRSLGASEVIAREELNEVVSRPLESERWAGCLDNVGGAMLARVLGQMKYGGSVAAIGLAGGSDLPASVIPFLLRGVNLLGIDSVMRPYEDRVQAWARLVEIFPFEKLEGMVSVKTLADLPELGALILKGKVKGRIVIDVNG